MIRLTESVDIDAAPARVWETVADYSLDPSWRTGVLEMEPTPRGLAAVGTTTAELMKFAGKRWRNDGVVTEVEPGRRLAWRTTKGADADGSRTVSSNPDGSTRVTLDLRVRPHGVERVMAPLLRRMLARNLRRDLDTLRHHLEDGDPPRSRDGYSSAHAAMPSSTGVSKPG